MSSIILITGGCRSGKSAFAVELARALHRRTVFLATCEPGSDPEMQRRVDAHRAARPSEWRLIEAPHDLTPDLKAVEEPVVVLDCLPAWIGNLLVRGDDAAGIDAASGLLLEAARACRARWLLAVSAEVGAGLVPETPLGRQFRDLVGLANQHWAAIAERVYLLAAGLPLEIKRNAVDAASIAASLEESSS